MPAGVYIHIPFCLKKCPYCDFYSVVASDDIRHSYALKLSESIKQFDSNRAIIDTIYFGGGTPSLMHPNDLKLILETIKSKFALAVNAEITIEANPCSVDFDKLLSYKEIGFNRISFGVQSANDNELTALGRLHDFSQAERAVLDAKLAGFENISCDLMLGTPYQTIESLGNSINKLTSLGIQHISCYMLKIEEGTAYDCDRIRKIVADEDTVSDMYLYMCQSLNALGFKQYEISNFSLEGYNSRHNMKYWKGDDYIGFGPSAHSCWQGKRFYVEGDLQAFLDGSFEFISDNEPMDKLEEYMMLSLRLSEGLSIDKFISLGGDKPKLMLALKPFIDAGYAEVDGDNVRLLPEGFLVSNDIIVKLIISQD